VLEQTTGELTDTFGFGLTVNVPEPDPVQPLVSVTATLYVPGTLTLIETVLLVNPPGPVQLYVKGFAVLPVTTAVNVAGNEFEQIATGATATFGFGLTVNVPEPKPTQPFVSITVTLYVLGMLTLIDCALLVNPPGPVQLYVKGLAVLPVTVAVRTATVFEHTVGELTVTFGFGLTVNLPDPVPVQPLVSVTVTLYVPGMLTLIDCVLLVNPPGPVQL
jgi:hypothetical protein